MLSLRQELSTCLKWWTNPMSPNLDIGPWTLNCWMSLSTELAPCCSMESFCHAVTSQFRSTNTRSASASNLSSVIGVLEGLRTCWILCIAHVPAALPFIYDRMNSIWLVLSGNLDPHRHMYRLHSALKQSRSSCRPVNRVQRSWGVWSWQLVAVGLQVVPGAGHLAGSVAPGSAV